MPPVPARAALAFALAVAVVTASPRASADEVGSGGAPSPDDAIAQARGEARRLAQRALELLDSDPAKARALFEAAEAKFHAPTHLLYLAQANVALGELEAAGRMYQRLNVEEIPDYAPEQFREAQRIGRDELAALAPKLGRFKVSVIPAPLPPTEAKYEVEGLPVRVDGGVLILAPGRHFVRATSPAGTSTRTVVATAGQVGELVFELRGGPTVPGAEDGGSDGLVIAGGVMLGVAGLATLLGGVMGGLSFGKVSELTDLCPDKVGCNPADEDLADEARLYGDLSTGLFITGGVSLASGIVMFVIDAVQSPAKRPAAPPAVQPVAGPGYLGISGRF
jgi:hypothetical protein